MIIILLDEIVKDTNEPKISFLIHLILFLSFPIYLSLEEVSTCW